MKKKVILRLALVLMVILCLLFFLEKLRKTILPNHYYIWEEKIKDRLAQCLKENINFVLLITLFFTFLFVFLLYVGLKPRYSVWVLLLGFLFVFLKYRKIAILEKMYLSVLTSSIVPTLILARLIFIECFFFLAEVLGNVWPVQQKMLLSVVTTLLVFPEGSLKKAVYVVKNFVNAQHGWYSEVVVTDEKVKKIGELRNEEKGTKKLIQTWENILKDFVMKENALHQAKLSNLVKLEGKSILSDYKYNTVLSKFLKPPVDLFIKEEVSMGLISFLNSPEATDFIGKLKETRKAMGSKEFAKRLEMFLQDSNLPGLTIRETNLLFSMLFTKAVTDELPNPLLKKGTLDILYDGAKGALPLEQKMTGYVDVKVDKHLEGALTRLLTKQVGFDEVFNGDAYMKLIKEQEGVAMKQRFLQKFGLSVLDVERDAKVDYKIKQSDGKEIFLECKSCWQNDIDKEITRTFEKVQGPFEMFWENTKTWDKTLYKIDEKGVKHVVYKECSPKKLN